MSSSQQTPEKRARQQSTVAPTMQPFRIPLQMISESKNLKTKLVKEKLLDQSAVQNYFFMTKYQSRGDTDATFQFRKSLKPKIQNRLHLQLPTQRKVSVHKYVGEEKHFEQSVSSFFGRIFKSCIQPQTSQEFQQCDYCEHQYPNDQEQFKEKQKRELLKQLSQPYVSYRRLNERQKQPIQVFYQEITNEPIKNNRWRSSYWESRQN